MSENKLDIKTSLIFNMSVCVCARTCAQVYVQILISVDHILLQSTKYCASNFQKAVNSVLFSIHVVLKLSPTRWQTISKV